MERGEYAGGASVGKAMQLMAKKLSNTHFVGLIAGWDDTTVSLLLFFLYAVQLG